MSPVSTAKALFPSAMQPLDAPASPTWSDVAFNITETPARDGLADGTALLGTTALAGDDLAAQMDTLLEDLLVAESWESMAMRSIARLCQPDRVGADGG
jgi:hypothetical protein